MFRRRFLGKTKVKPILPAAYQQVEYLQSSGNGTNSGGQFINSGINFGGFTAIVDFEPSASFNGERALFSQYGGGINFVFNWKADGSWVSGYGCNATTTPSTAVQVGTRYLAQGVSAYSESTSTIRPCWIFGQNEGRDYGYHSSSIKLYHCKVFKTSDNTVIYRDFYPCYRKSDNKPGLYDIINDVFYTNCSGGTDFTVGPNYVGIL